MPLRSHALLRMLRSGSGTGTGLKDFGSRAILPVFRGTSAATVMPLMSRCEGRTDRGAGHTSAVTHR
jgi:hypothetical protein